MKPIVLLLLMFGTWNLHFAQEKKILNILNRELEKEIKNQFKSRLFNGDTISIIKEFSIDNEKKLAFEIKIQSPYVTGTQFIRQEVPLDKLRKIGKDIQIILEAEENSVVTTVINSEADPKEQITKGNLFYLYMSSEKNNEELGEALQNAFKKAGHSLTKEYWAD
ncbi:hypothetical protein [Chryseobacterium defluvii]|uniref:Uncharacterized protein n=1 Tax=Chryseobacterium defluvii TaxID=160396 RepID=A0A495SN44_9FLAO|nr:hypothetical protein [Chryseobacterium defluvii]RKT00860.1 hypothetical protein BCF58_0061 [Chryseobacterium defluvii]